MQVTKLSNPEEGCAIIFQICAPTVLLLHRPTQSVLKSISGMHLVTKKQPVQKGAPMHVTDAFYLVSIFYQVSLSLSFLQPPTSGELPRPATKTKTSCTKTVLTDKQKSTALVSSRVLPCVSVKRNFTHTHRHRHTLSLSLFLRNEYRVAKTRQVLNHWGLRPKPETVFLIGHIDSRHPAPLSPSLGSCTDAAKLFPTKPGLDSPAPGNPCPLLRPSPEDSCDYGSGSAFCQDTTFLL